jgi:3-hydroxyisobutyrate dehydrogenase
LRGAFAEAGLKVVGYDLDQQASEAAQSIGVAVVDGVRSVAASCRTIFLSLPDSAAVDQVIRGPSVLSEACNAGTVLIDTTPRLPNRPFITSAGLPLNRSGSSTAPLSAQARKLATDWEWHWPETGRRRRPTRHFLHTFSKQIFYLGAAGRGHTAKLVVNLVLCLLA